MFNGHFCIYGEVLRLICGNSLNWDLLLFFCSASVDFDCYSLFFCLHKSDISLRFSVALLIPEVRLRNTTLLLWYGHLGFRLISSIRAALISIALATGTRSLSSAMIPEQQELELRAHIRNLLLIYAKTHLAQDYITLTEDAVSDVSNTPLAGCRY